MRILIFTQHFPPETMATGRRASDLAESLAARGHDVTVITGQPNHPASLGLAFCRRAAKQEWAPEGFRILRVPVFRSTHAGAVWRFLTYASFMLSAACCGIRQRRADALLAISPLPTGLAALPAHWWQGAPLVFDLQDIWPDSARAIRVMPGGCLLSLLRRVERFFYRRCARVVGISEGFKQYLVGLGLPRENVAVIPNGVRWQSFAGSAPDEELRQLRELRGKFLVGYVGNHGLAQGLETVLDAAEKLHDQPVEFLLAGEGIDKARIIRLARTRGLENVRFLDGMPRERVNGVLLACDALLLILRNDPLFEITIPSKLYEYMAAGKPLLCSVAGEAAAWVSATGCGLVVAPLDGAALADGVRKLLRNPLEARAMGEAGAKSAQELFSRDMLMAGYAELLRELTFEAAHPAESRLPIALEMREP
jgi:glycosyltransferase involved in cell wall biosynthesis